MTTMTPTMMVLDAADKLEDAIRKIAETTGRSYNDVYLQIQALVETELCTEEGWE